MAPSAQAKPFVPMHHTMTMAVPARTVTQRRPAVAVKTDVKTGHDIAYVTRGHAAGCAGAMAYYTRTGDPPGTWEGRGCAALGVSGRSGGRLGRAQHRDAQARLRRPRRRARGRVDSPDGPDPAP